MALKSILLRVGEIRKALTHRILTLRLAGKFRDIRSHMYFLLV